MKRIVSIFFVCLFSFAGTSVFSQKNDEVSIKGTVYMNASRSQGIRDGKTFSEPQSTFRNQPIYFKKDTSMIKSKTDSAGVYTAVLKPGTYEVFQEAGLKVTKSGMQQIGTYVIEVKKDGGPYDIFFKNHVNGRSVMGGGIPDGGTKKKIQKNTYKKE